MPTNITVRGVVFAAPTAPGYTPGARVVVTATFQFSDSQVTTIDGASGGPITVGSVSLTNVKYILTTGTNAQNVNPTSDTNTVHVGSVQRERAGDGIRAFRALLSDRSGNGYHTGNVTLAGWATIGTTWEGPPADPEEAPIHEPGYGLFVQHWATRDFVGGPVSEDHSDINFAAAAFGWAGADPGPGGILMTDPRISIRAVGYARIPSAGNWRFRAVRKRHSGFGLWLDSTLVINSLGRGPQAGTEIIADVTPFTEYTENQMVPIRLDYQHNYGPHAVRLEWEKQGDASVIIPDTSLYSGAEVGTISVVPPPDQVEWYVESVNRYQET